MGDESNEFHREVVRPKVTELLSPNPADYIFEYCVWQWKLFFVSCTKRRSVVAFDYSKKMIELG